MDDSIPNSSQRERKFYALTELGRGALNAEAVRLQKLVNLAQIQTAEKIS